MTLRRRTRGLERLAVVYGLVERMRSLDVRVAADAVNECVTAMALQRDVASMQGARGRAALREGDRQAWTLAASQAELAQAQHARVETLRRSREATRAAAMETYRESRMRLEQMQQVVRKTKMLEAQVQQRRMQAALDDGHLARLNAADFVSGGTDDSR